jgi:murein DD-endopeptidase MepM/ murein hydrolase activator NlpD
MKIIFLPDSSRKSLSFCLRPAPAALLVIVAVSVLGAAFYGGLHYAGSGHAGVYQGSNGGFGTIWDQELSQQREFVMRARQDAEKSLDAMAGRLGILQGHVLRLNALGSRLAAMAGVDMEFGLESPPGMGGPEPDADLDSLNSRDFIAELSNLEHALQDQSDKLFALESIMMERSLREQTNPDGSPVAEFWLSSPFGFRTDPLTGRREFHTGIDFAGAAGSPVTAVAAGIVTWSGPRLGYGNVVEVSHGNGYFTRYGHNSRNLVGIGDKVKKGDVVALLGASGRTTGPHVHFEVVRNGEFVNPRGKMKL